MNTAELCFFYWRFGLQIKHNLIFLCLVWRAYRRIMQQQYQMNFLGNEVLMLRTDESNSAQIMSLIFDWNSGWWHNFYIVCHCWQWCKHYHVVGQCRWIKPRMFYLHFWLLYFLPTSLIWWPLYARLQNSSEGILGTSPWVSWPYQHKFNLVMGILFELLFWNWFIPNLGTKNSLRYIDEV